MPSVLMSMISYKVAANYFDLFPIQCCFRIKALTVALKALKLACVHGIAVEVWWGIVERFSPLAYDWSLYEEIFKLVSDSDILH
ncbi:inactive beta-amylase 4, chloroplastic-like, partial [Malus sylvestris]|uniref:inactive beta-amylase 4, chloroplastic-like n=1 Tax=Malus sylvestris TaxID=3752 RepID=UPI0021ABACF6